MSMLDEILAQDRNTGGRRNSRAANIGNRQSMKLELDQIRNTMPSTTKYGNSKKMFNESIEEDVDPILA